MGGSNFAQAATNYFWVDPTQYNTRNEASQLSQSVTYFQEKKLSHKCSTLVFKLLLLSIKDLPSGQD